jgi:hypothetical protein
LADQPGEHRARQVGQRIGENGQRGAERVQVPAGRPPGQAGEVAARLVLSQRGRQLTAGYDVADGDRLR